MLLYLRMNKYGVKLVILHTSGIIYPVTFNSFGLRDHFKSNYMNDLPLTLPDELTGEIINGLYGPVFKLKHL